MKKSERTIRKTFRLSDEEADKLKANADLCGLSETEYLRQLIVGNRPKALPDDRFWDKMNELYECHSKLKRRAQQFENESELNRFYTDRADELQDLVMRIIEEYTQPEQL